MALFFSPFRWLWIVLGIIVLAIFGVILVSTIYFGLILGHAVIFGVPHVFPYFGFGFGFVLLGLLVFALVAGLIFRPSRRRMYYSHNWYRYDSAMD